MQNKHHFFYFGVPTSGEGGGSTRLVQSTKFFQLKNIGGSPYTYKCRQTTDHVLSNCKVALDTGRFTWRHNCVINFIVSSIDSQYTVYSDLPGHTAPGGGSIPPELCVTSQEPDIVIIDKHKQTIHLFELTCPAERNLDTRHEEKTNKYASQLTSLISSAK